ncbi:hypothetical protein PCANC_17221 [Puccinia coronata f. sp. avenae]|uniref:Meiotic recombination protein dmc1 n=1 Tax=Puccinia coronata f. sp. avenae TaxID=200324 RepID=A0A2N5SG07_9BASI|nr:hypothetical protein PCANC_17221 [Puccinia coronata f. sp. avenae]PLW47348.1 hypothetical protein PCASD_02620 [Puccinia coronata f. sp. avenae]
MAEATTEARFYTDVDALQELGISAQDIKKLKDGGYATVKAVLTASRKQLTNIKGISEIKVEKIKDSASKLSGPSFKTGSDVLVDREKILTLSTGSKAVDAMLGGGIQSQSITEVYGEFRCGKTQLCHTLCVTAQLPPEMGGGGGKAAYIDTEGTFRPERVRAIADRFGMDPEAVLDNIIVGRAANSEHQMELIVHLAAKFAEDGTFRLLIVDSIMALFRVDFSGRGELSERQQKLNQMLARLTRISEEFNLCIFLTNQVQADPGAASMFAGADKKPVGGHVLAHAASTRISLRKGRGDERVAKLCDSPDMPEGEASYKIATGGIEDC